MPGNEFAVHPDELDKFSQYLEQTTAPAVKQAAADVHGSNGFDFDAFGAVLGQVLGIPARIALAAVGDNLSGVSDNVAHTSELTKKAAKAYRDQDASAKEGIDKFLPELTK